ncbi:MAG TPA: 1-phosphofructokinase family hexose kinase [Limnochordia bacterium]|nr:1-phosphofructokinase family hexose kinase [Limnochordia bacterium]
MTNERRPAAIRTLRPALLTVTANPSVDKAYRLPEFRLGTAQRVQDGLTLAAGKGVNVAKVVRQLGAPVTATGLLAGFNGRFVEAQLQAIGVDCRFCWRPGETRVSISLVDAKSGALTEVIEEGPQASAADADAMVARVGELVSPGALVTLCGSLPPGLPTDTYPRMIRSIRERGATVLLDSSGGALWEGVRSGPDIVKPNLDELATLAAHWGLPGAGALPDFGRQGPEAPWPEALVRAVDRLRMYVPVALCTFGARGAALVTPYGIWELLPPPVRVISAVGAGDAVVGGLCVARLKGDGWLDAAVFAIACGASATERLATGEIDPSRVLWLKAGVRVRPLR